jgi:hypothetical protein
VISSWKFAAADRGGCDALDKLGTALFAWESFIYLSFFPFLFCSFVFLFVSTLCRGDAVQYEMMTRSSGNAIYKVASDFRVLHTSLLYEIGYLDCGFDKQDILFVNSSMSHDILTFKSSFLAIAIHTDLLYRFSNRIFCFYLTDDPPIGNINQMHAKITLPLLLSNCSS